MTPVLGLLNILLLFKAFRTFDMLSLPVEWNVLVVVSKKLVEYLDQQPEIGLVLEVFRRTAQIPKITQLSLL